MKPILLSITMGVILLLSACSPKTLPQPEVQVTQIQSSAISTTQAAPTSIPLVSDTLTLTDQQGAVVVEVTPLNLNQPGDTLDFQVVLDTHSVDLGMDLATLSTLTTDTGIVDQAVLWNGQNGGHHVSGTLSFLASLEGTSVLDGARKLILTIRNVDAPQRIFTWDLP